MLYLILSIIVASGIFVVFRISGLKGQNAISIVCFNYFVALIFGAITLIYGGSVDFNQSALFYLFAFIVGLLYMLFFLLIHKSTNIAGVSITSAATKLSVIFPVVLSLLIDKNDSLYAAKSWGILILLVSFLLIVNPKNSKLKLKNNINLPIILFLGMGLVDSLIKVSQQLIVPESSVKLFTFFIFVSAAITGFIVLVYKREVRSLTKKPVIVLGSVLGLINYGSLYFLLNALNTNLSEAKFLDSSRIFMFNNLGILLLSTFLGVFLFKERLNYYNLFGILLSVVGFYLLI